MKHLGLGIIVAIGLTLPAFGQGVDPLIGTWKLNLEKSQFPFPPPKSQTLTFVMGGQNIINTAEGVGGDGKPFKVVFQHIYDGQPHPTTGTELYDSSAFTRIGNTINIARYKDGKMVQLVQGVIVPGKTITFSAGGVFNGQPFHVVTVYDRQ
jgi:hypothetical protein